MCGECWAEGTQEGRRGGGGGQQVVGRERSPVSQGLWPHIPFQEGGPWSVAASLRLQRLWKFHGDQGAFPSLDDPCIQSTSAQASSRMAMEGLAAHGHLQL